MALKVAAKQFTIQNSASGLVLDINDEDDKVQLWPYNGKPNQLWQYDFATHCIYNPASGMALDIDADDDTTLHVWQRNQRPNQQWLINPFFQTITNPETGNVIDADRGVLEPGTACIAWSRRDAAPNQQWQLRSVSGGAHGGGRGGGRGGSSGGGGGRGGGRGGGGSGGGGGGGGGSGGGGGQFVPPANCETAATSLRLNTHPIKCLIETYS
jgi:hypothetical protein